MKGIISSLIGVSLKEIDGSFFLLQTKEVSGEMKSIARDGYLPVVMRGRICKSFVALVYLYFQNNGNR